MIGRFAAVTKNIRVGSGGVMLPQPCAAVVAERFKMLEALFPGRIDLGLASRPVPMAPRRMRCAAARSPRRVTIFSNA